jgi:hypothetical protein
MHRFALPLALLLLAVSAHADVASQIVIFDKQFGKACNSPTSMSIKYKNVGPDTVDVKVCLKLRGQPGKWDCVVVNGMKPNAQSSTYACKADGRIRVFVVRTGSGDQLPADPID